MSTRDRSALGSLYRALVAGASALPGGAWLIAWLNPLHLARLKLREAVAARAHYASGRALDLGCGARPYMELFGHVEQYVGLDLPDVPAADVHGDGQTLPFQSASFDTVLCNEVLEHVPEPARLLREAARVLRPGGVLLLTTPQTWGLHHEPHDFYRYTRYGLRHLAAQAGLEVLEVAPTSGLWATLAQRLADTVAHTYVRRPGTLAYGLAMVGMAPVLLAGYALDALFGKRGDTLDNLLVARKAG
ncbi:MAG TPA: class I SAM-dependent methyltransferase [Chloroflexaceae bacterium]|nr:class I SAM-dependent methyltransferase [Chloroflexaceae bacterium]